jgi:hypothetical protein
MPHKNVGRGMYFRRVGFLYATPLLLLLLGVVIVKGIVVGVLDCWVVFLLVTASFCGGMECGSNNKVLVVEGVWDHWYAASEDLEMSFSWQLGRINPQIENRAATLKREQILLFFGGGGMFSTKRMQSIYLDWLMAKMRRLAVFYYECCGRRCMVFVKIIVTPIDP